MFDGRSLMPEMLQATPENKARLKRWLARVRPGGGTDPREAVYFALGLDASAVFLLSDGEFNGHRDGKNSSLLVGNPTVFEVVESESGSEVPIHTFAYQDASSSPNMRELADQTGGQYRFVSASDGIDEVAKAIKPRKPVDPARRADSLLRLADILQAQGHRREAFRRYERIASDFPNTTAAKVARRRVQDFTSP